MLTKEQLHYKTFSKNYNLCLKKKNPHLFAVTFSSLQGGLFQSHSQNYVTLVQQHYVLLLSVPLDKGNADSGNKIVLLKKRGYDYIYIYIYFFFFFFFFLPLYYTE